MTDLYPDEWEPRLRHLVARFEYPATPDIARQVVERTHRARRPRRTLRYVLVAVVVVLLFVSPLTRPLRAAVAQFWRLGAIEFVVATPVPTMLADPSITPQLQPTATPPQPSPTAVRSVPRVFGETTLERARERVPFPIQLPTYPDDVGPPDQVFVQDRNGVALIMVWHGEGAPAGAFSLQVFDSDMVARKLLLTTEQAQHTTVGDQPAVWLDVPHVLEYVEPEGQARQREGRFVEGNVLVWVEGDLTYRLESSLSLAEARRLAESLR